MGRKEPTFVTLFLPEYISDQAIDLLSPILERFMPVFKGSLIGTIGMQKDMSKFSS